MPQPGASAADLQAARTSMLDNITQLRLAGLSHNRHGPVLSALERLVGGEAAGLMRDAFPDTPRPAPDPTSELDGASLVPRESERRRRPPAPALREGRLPPVTARTRHFPQMPPSGTSSRLRLPNTAQDSALLPWTAARQVGEPLSELTELDLVAHQLRQPGDHYELLTLLGEVLGPAMAPTGPVGGLDQAAPDRRGIPSEAEIEMLPVAPVTLVYRRTTAEGRTKQKLDVMGVRVEGCAICTSRYRAEQLACLLPCQHVCVPIPDHMTVHYSHRLLELTLNG